jgi:hypothetical protein
MSESRIDSVPNQYHRVQHQSGPKTDLLVLLCRGFQRLLPNSAPDPKLNTTGAASDHFIVSGFLSPCFGDKVVTATLRALQLYGNTYWFVHKQGPPWPLS